MAEDELAKLKTQKAALKVEVVGMMKERDEARIEAVHARAELSERHAAELANRDAVYADVHRALTAEVAAHAATRQECALHDREATRYQQELRKEYEAHKVTAAERDALREEVARLEEWKRTTIADETKALCSENAALEAKLGQAVAALRDAVKHCRQCNGIGEYWPHCDACADSTCDHECPPRQLCGVCAEWRAILDPESTATVEAYKREREERDSLKAEIAMLRGVDCGVDGDGPCGVCIKCARNSVD